MDLKQYSTRLLITICPILYTMTMEMPMNCYGNKGHLIPRRMSITKSTIASPLLPHTFTAFPLSRVNMNYSTVLQISCVQQTNYLSHQSFR